MNDTHVSVFPVKHYRYRGYVRGRKKLCAKEECYEPRAGKHPYCRDHKNEYQREWARARTARLHELENGGER